MNLEKILSSAVAAAVILVGSLSVTAQEKKSDAKPTEPAKAEPAKAKAEKVSGDIGLLDTEKNYLIVVTKDGKLVTIDVNAKTKAMQLVDSKVKMSDVGLGSQAQVEYVVKGEKNFLTKMIFVPAKGE